MARKDEFELLEWKPVTGLLDNRSSPDDMPPFSWRFRQNIWVPEEGTAARAPGWKKLFDKTPYNNEDLHDQLLSLQQYYDVVDNVVDPDEIMAWPDPTGTCGGTLHTRTTGRQPITLQFEAVSTTGSRRLIVATESRIYSLNEFTGNWRLLADGYGEGTDDGTMPRTRFYCTQNADAVLFTNDFNRPIIHYMDQPFFGCDIQAVAEIPDLETIGVTKAAVCWTWRNVTFLCDIEQDGLRHENRLIWSDYGDPTSWDPARPESIAGREDLDYGEKILGGAEAGDVFLIYTNRRIWEMQAVGGEILFTFHKRYTPEVPGESCLAYRNTLVAYRETHFFCGNDGVYAYNLQSLGPERVPWIHRGTGIMFNDISDAFCNNHVAAVNATSKELWISWVPEDSTDGLPTRTMAINLRFPAVHTIDHGFTSFVNYRPDPKPSVRDFMLSNCICDAAGLDALGYGYRKEGIPVSEATCATLLTSIYTDVSLPVLDGDVEDYRQLTFAAGSLCELLGDQRLDTQCRICEAAPTFIMASATDWALKEFDAEVFYREMVDPEDYDAVGAVEATGYATSSVLYLIGPYDSIWRSGAMSLGSKREEKTFRRLVVMAIAAPQTTPSNLELRVGTSSQPADPNNTAACSLLWRIETPKALECMDPRTAAQHAAARSRPSGVLEWPLYERGYFLYFELKIAGTGGSTTFSEILLGVTQGNARQRF